MITKKQKQLEEEIEDLMAERPGHHEEEDDEEMEHTVEGEEGEGDKNKGEQTDKENRVVRHYRSKADELEEQEDTTNKKRQKSSGDRGKNVSQGMIGTMNVLNTESQMNIIRMFTEVKQRGQMTGTENLTTVEIGMKVGINVPVVGRGIRNLTMRERE